MKLSENYVIGGPQGKAEILAAEKFWEIAMNKEHPKNKPDFGYLISQFDFESDWDSWEIHPNGDEVVYCISGQILFILEEPGGLREVTLGAGDFVVVPQNTWHTAKVSQPSKAIFVTWGYGTLNKDVIK